MIYGCQNCVRWRDGGSDEGGWGSSTVGAQAMIGPPSARTGKLRVNGLS